jgi:phospholipid transport system substrate-binding protein
MKILTTLFLSLGLLFAAAPASAGENDPNLPPQVVAKRASEDVIIALAKDPRISKDKARALAFIDEKILPYFDFQSMTRLAVGRGWRDATPEQQARLTQEFRTLLVRTYAASLDTLRGAEVDYRSVNVGPNDKRAVVKALVKRPGMQPLSMEMAVERQPDGWRVIDVAIENLSLVTNYRSEFAMTVQRDGINGLLKSLAERNTPRENSTADK